MFDLNLRFAPSFHRTCSIRVVGEAVSEAIFEAPPSGFLPRVALTLEVDERRSAELRASCQGMLQVWDNRWSSSGLDGISVDGIFDDLEAAQQPFRLWSPPNNSVAHSMLAAALACFPPHLCVGAAEGPIEILRSYFGLQPAVVLTGDGPFRLRLAPWLHRRHAQEVEQEVLSLPDGAAVLIDAEGVERFGPALPSILPMTQLLKRSPSVRWIARDDAVEALRTSGVALSEIETVPRSRLTETGHPIVLGGLVVNSPETIALARASAKIDLIRVLRDEYRLTVAQAAQATSELIDLIRESEAST